MSPYLALAATNCVSLTEVRWEDWDDKSVTVEVENKFLFVENCQVRMLSRSFNIINVPSPVWRPYFTLSKASNIVTLVYSLQSTVCSLQSTVYMDHNLQCWRFWKRPTSHQLHHSFQHLKMSQIPHCDRVTFIWDLDLHQITSGAN